MTYRTLFLIRARYEGVVVDSRVSYVTDEVTEALRAEEIAAKLTGDQPDIEGLMKKFPKAAEAAGAYGRMQLRMRMNSDMYGPFNIISDHEPTDEELVAWWKEKK